jgi:dTDP-glucose pyrophosphorylase
VPLGGSTLLAGLISHIGRFHSSAKPPVVIVDAQDRETPEALAVLLPEGHIVRQPQPDGVANALLLAQPLLDDLAIVTLGDLFLDGTLPAMPHEPGVVFWREAPPEETAKNFGITSRSDGLVSEVVEKPTDACGLSCGMGVYVLTRSGISCFHKAPIDPATGERGITYGIQAAIAAGLRFRAIPFSGYYNNVNSSADVIAVETYLAGPAR